MYILGWNPTGKAPIIVALGNSTVPTVRTRLKGGALAVPSGLLPTAGRTVPSPQAWQCSSVPWMLLSKALLWGQVTLLALQCGQRELVCPPFHLVVICVDQTPCGTTFRGMGVVWTISAANSKLNWHLVSPSDI